MRKSAIIEKFCSYYHHYSKNAQPSTVHRTDVKPFTQCSTELNQLGGYNHWIGLLDHLNCHKTPCSVQDRN